ncbi:MAG: phage tail tape measure protein [Synergistaceae bacterium]|nr:phage tail tape measure protein [Synergistaceae bacterium]
MSKMVEIGFVIGATLAGGFKGAFSNAGQTINQLQQQTKNFQKVSGQIGDYQKMQKSIVTNQAAMMAMRRQAKSLGEQIALSGGKTEQLSSQYQNAKAEVDRLNRTLIYNQEAHKIAKDSAENLRNQIKESSQPTAELRNRYKEAKAEVEKLGKTEKQTSAELKAAKNTSAQLERAMKASALTTKSLSNEAEKLNTRADKLEKGLYSDREALAKLRTELSGAGIDTKKLASEQERLAAKSKKVSDAQNRLQRSISNLRAAKEQLSFSSIQSSLISAAGMGYSLYKPVMKAADFEAAMARVNAVAFSGAGRNKEQDAKDFALLQKQARDLGASTQFTSVQAANTQENLARAGFNTNEIIAAMPGLLSMAAAENMDLAQAADIASSTLRGFNLAADQSNRVSDILAQMSASSNTNIAELGEGMKKVAPVAAGLGISIEQVSAMMGVMANNGIKGTEAGTALRAALSRLSQEPKAVAKALGVLGVKATDAKGRLRQMPELMQALSKRMKGMGEAKQMHYLINIFGKEASAGMLAIMQGAVDGSLEEYERLADNSAGISKEMADKMLDTMRGQMTIAGSAIESLMIDIGEVLRPTVKEMVKAFSTWTAGLSELAQKHPEATKAIIGTLAGFAAMNVSITAVKIAWRLLTLPIKEGIVVFDWLRAKLILIGNSSLYAAAKTKILTAAQKTWQFVMKAGSKLLDVGKFVLYHAKELAITAATKAWTAALWLWNAAMNANPIGLLIIGIAALIGVCYLLYKNWDKIKELGVKMWGWIKEKAQALADWWDSWTLADIFAPIINFANDCIEGLKGIWQSFKDWIVGLFDFDLFSGIFSSTSAPTAAQIEANKAAHKELINRHGTDNWTPSYMHAAGGIFSTPHLGLVAEAGREAIIPLENKSRGIPLWQAAGEELGFKFGSTTNNNTKNNSVSLSPVFNFTINNSDAQDNIGLEARLRSIVEDCLANLQNEWERVSFA